MLFWSDNAFVSDPTRFAVYRVYSTSYDLDAGLCGVSWAVEGTTVAPEFLVGALIERCAALLRRHLPEPRMARKASDRRCGRTRRVRTRERAGIRVRHQARFVRIPFLGRL